MTQPEAMPRLVADLAFEAWVTIAEHISIGASSRGRRGLIPITGGTFAGERIRGEVLPGGADWQLIRADGVLEADARYTIRTDDGFNIQVRNRGIIVFPPHTEPFGQTIYARTVPEFEAPLDSPHAWLNRSMFLGTIELAGPGRVRICVYRVA